jgi:hypothetical protein
VRRCGRFLTPPSPSFSLILPSLFPPAPIPSSLLIGTLSYTLAFVLIFIHGFNRLSDYPVVLSGIVLIAIAGQPGLSVGACWDQAVFGALGVAVGGACFAILAKLGALTFLSLTCVFLPSLPLSALCCARAAEARRAVRGRRLTLSSPQVTRKSRKVSSLPPWSTSSPSSKPNQCDTLHSVCWQSSCPSRASTCRSSRTALSSQPTSNRISKPICGVSASSSSSTSSYCLTRRRRSCGNSSSSQSSTSRHCALLPTPFPGRC